MLNYNNADELNILVDGKIVRTIKERYKKRTEDMLEYLYYLDELNFPNDNRADEATTPKDAKDELTLTAKSARREEEEVILTQEEKKKLIERADDDLLEWLVYAYTDGVQAAGEMLGAEIVPDIEKMYDAVFAETAGETFQDRVESHIEDGDPDKVLVVADTDFHRVFNTAIYDVALDLGASKKEWVTMADEKVRSTHSYLEGMAVGIDEPFYTYDGDYALFPGDFTLAENNVNCRCFLYIS